MTSYAASAVAFRDRPPSTLSHSFPDGTSNTILFAGHYAFRCDEHNFNWAEHLAFAFPPADIGGKPRVMRRATFADREIGDVYPVGRGAFSEGSVPGLTFQARPSLAECNPRVAQTPHEAGMVVGLADGSVRTLNAGMSSRTYWSAVTPSGGEVLGPDW